MRRMKRKKQQREREREHEWGKGGIKEGPTYASMSLRFPGGGKHENRVAIMHHLHWSCRTPVRCWSRLQSQRFVFARWSTLWPLLLGMRWLQPLVGTPTRSGPWTVIKVLTLAVHGPDPDGRASTNVMPFKAFDNLPPEHKEALKANEFTFTPPEACRRIGSKRIQGANTGPDRVNRLLARSKHKVFGWVFAKSKWSAWKVLLASTVSHPFLPLGWCPILPF